MSTMSASEAQRLLAGTGVGDGLRACSLDVSSRGSVSAGELPELVRGGAGLLVYTDGVNELGGELSRTERLLSAEVAFTGGERSVHIHWDGSAYRVTTYVETAGETHLCYEESHLSVERGKRVTYAVYVEPRPEGGDAEADIPFVDVWRPAAARFVGLVDEKEG